MPAPLPFEARPNVPVALGGVGALVFTAGYRPDYASWVNFPEAFDDAGFPIQTDGSSTTVPGLHFMGVHFQRKLKSATLLGVAEDAEILAERIVASRSSALSVLERLEPASSSGRTGAESSDS